MKATSTETIRKQIDAGFKVVVRGGKVCLLDVDKNGKLLNYNEVVKAEDRGLYE